MACVVFNLAAIISYIASLKLMKNINEKKEEKKEENDIASHKPKEEKNDTDSHKPKEETNDEKNDIDSHKPKEEKNEEKNDIDSLKHEEKINEKKETNEEENEIAMKYFQVSAGLFQSIKNILKDNNLKDMGGKSIDCLNKLMLAQAQECCLEMEITKRFGFSRISSVACSLGKTYHKIVNMMIELIPQFDSTWITIINVNNSIT